MRSARDRAGSCGTRARLGNRRVSGPGPIPDTPGLSGAISLKPQQRCTGSSRV